VVREKKYSETADPCDPLSLPSSLRRSKRGLLYQLAPRSVVSDFEFWALGASNPRNLFENKV
jgi:hypothetical protein